MRLSKEEVALHAQRIKVIVRVDPNDDISNPLEPWFLPGIPMRAEIRKPSEDTILKVPSSIEPVTINLGNQRLLQTRHFNTDCFKPTFEEVVTQIPDQILDLVIGFEIIIGTQKLKQPHGTKFFEATTVLYLK